MKIGGRKVTRSEEVLVLPRLGGDIIIKAHSVSINAEFDKIVPEPTAPGIRTKSGFEPDYKDTTYRKQVSLREERRFAYMILRSIEPSDIEWVTVDLDKPDTWSNWIDELQENGLSEVETSRIVQVAMAANTLDESKLREARERFLRGQGE